MAIIEKMFGDRTKAAKLPAKTVSAVRQCSIAAQMG
jgi:hypothetical protein